jgi:anti-sigma regulatory factor (Ser/Thr protein kinase)
MTAPEVVALPARPASLGQVQRFVEELATCAVLDEHRTYRLRLAAEEMATNIVQHARFPAGNGAASFVLEGGVLPELVWLRLVDAAGEFDPTAAPPPADLHEPLDRRRVGGLGIHLTRQMVDEFSYQRLDGRNRTTLAVRRSA